MQVCASAVLQAVVLACRHADLQACRYVVLHAAMAGDLRDKSEGFDTAELDNCIFAIYYKTKFAI